MMISIVSMPVHAGAGQHPSQWRACPVRAELGRQIATTRVDGGVANENEAELMEDEGDQITQRERQKQTVSER